MAENETLSITNSMDIDLSKLRKIVENREAWHAAVLQRVGHDLVTEQQQHAFLKLSCMSTLYIFYIKSLWSISFSNILFSRQPFYFVDSFQKLLSLIRFHLFDFVFISITVGGRS